MLLLFLALGALATSPSLQAQQNIIKDDWPMFADPVMPQEYKILVVTEKPSNPLILRVCSEYILVANLLIYSSGVSLKFKSSKVICKNASP